MRTVKVKAAGRYGPKYGRKVREKLTGIEKKQRKKQSCPFCRRQALKRLAKGIWLCKKCSKKFASHAYYIK